MRKKLLTALSKQSVDAEMCQNLDKDQRNEVMQLLDLKKDAINICTHDLVINKGNCRDKKCFAYNMVSYVDLLIEKIIDKLPCCNDCSLCVKE